MFYLDFETFDVSRGEIESGIKIESPDDLKNNGDLKMPHINELAKKYREEGGYRPGCGVKRSQACNEVYAAIEDHLFRDGRPPAQIPPDKKAKGKKKSEEKLKKEAPKQETKKEAPKQEAPKQEAPKQEAPKQEAPKQEAPKQEAPKQEETKPKKKVVKKTVSKGKPVQLVELVKEVISGIKKINKIATPEIVQGALVEALHGKRPDLDLSKSILAFSRPEFMDALKENGFIEEE